MYLKKITKGNDTYYLLVVFIGKDDNKQKVEKFIKEDVYNALLSCGIKSY